MLVGIWNGVFTGVGGSKDANFTEESSFVKFSRETGRILCTVSSGQWLGAME